MRIIDMLMFSINPVYDYGRGEFAFGENAERYDLYRRCQKEGVGISVMKPFCGGQLLDAGAVPLQKGADKRSASPMRSTSPAFSPSFPGYGANRSCARSFPILKRLRRSATMPKLPRLQLPPRSAPASTASTAIRVLPDSTLR